jgi:hypothetical protein
MADQFGPLSGNLVFRTGTLTTQEAGAQPPLLISFERLRMVAAEDSVAYEALHTASQVSRCAHAINLQNVPKRALTRGVSYSTLSQ